VNRGAAAATDVGAANAAREVVATWGSAADAVVAGWFALAGTNAEGLLAPVLALVAGPGAGARLFDGRASP
jgi:gamma-glutamyltranspeptidase/glutathione hydrolase